MNRLKLLKATPHRLAYANTTTPYDPELWANESLAILEENISTVS